MKICLKGYCVSNDAAPKGDCLFPEDIFRASLFKKKEFNFDLPNEVMTCQEVIEYSIKNLAYSPSQLCTSNNMFKLRCCHTCKSKKI